jgi:hypothetical protein
MQGRRSTRGVPFGSSFLGWLAGCRARQAGQADLLEAVGVAVEQAAFLRPAQGADQASPSFLREKESSGGTPQAARRP